MLIEYKNVKQEKGSYRRCFGDENNDLYVWYDKEGGTIIGFQLCYNKRKDEHSITWKNGKGYIHSKIDDGEGNPGKTKESPILVEDGYFDKEKITEHFKNISRNIEKDLVDFICNKLLDYDETKMNPFL